MFPDTGHPLQRLSAIVMPGHPVGSYVPGIVAGAAPALPTDAGDELDTSEQKATARTGSLVLRPRVSP